MVGILAKSIEYHNAICIFNNQRRRGLGAVVVAGSRYTQAARSMGSTASFSSFLHFSWFFINTSTDNACPSRGPHWPGRIMSIYKMLCLAEYIILSIIPHRFISRRSAWSHNTLSMPLNWTISIKCPSAFYRLLDPKLIHRCWCTLWSWTRRDQLNIAWRDVQQQVELQLIKP